MCGPFEIKFQMHLYSRRKQIVHNHQPDILLTSLKEMKMIMFRFKYIKKHLYQHLIGKHAIVLC